jgi:hypothetical protein
MASNVPILAWDQGSWLDPNRDTWEEQPVAASSVPYFSPACGERFTGAADFAPALDRFWANLHEYAPRSYVGEHLSLRESAELFLAAYYDAAGEPSRPSAQFQDGDATGARPSLA